MEALQGKPLMIGVGAAAALVVFAIGVYKDISSSMDGLENVMSGRLTALEDNMSGRLSSLEQKSWMRGEQYEYRQLVDVKLDAMDQRVRRLEDFTDVKRFSETTGSAEVALCQDSLMRWAIMDFGEVHLAAAP